jgi:hypothetical protein
MQLLGVPPEALTCLPQLTLAASGNASAKRKF